LDLRTANLLGSNLREILLPQLVIMLSFLGALFLEGQSSEMVKLLFK